MAAATKRLHLPSPCSVGKEHKMLCHNCKEEIYDNPRSCPYCGVALPQQTETDETSHYTEVITILPGDETAAKTPSTKTAVAVAERPAASQPSAFVSFGQLEAEDSTPSEPLKRRFRFRYVLIPAAVIIAAVIAYVLVLDFFKPELFASLNVLLGDVKTRADCSVLVAAKPLIACLEDGEINAGISYTDAYGDTFSGTVILSSDIDANLRNFAINASLYEKLFDVTLFVGDEHAAIGSSRLGSEFYGLRFDTFAEDFDKFAKAAGLEDIDSAGYADFVRFMDSIFGGDTTLTMPESTRNALSATFAEFFRDIQRDETREKITVADSRVVRYAYIYNLTVEDLVNLGNKLIELTRKDEYLRGLLTAYIDRRCAAGIPYRVPDNTSYDLPLSAAASSDYTEPVDNLLNDLQYTLDFLNSKCSGGFTISYAIINNRLSAVSFYSDSFMVDGIDQSIRLALSFGLSVYDEWMLECYIHNENASLGISAVYEFYDENGTAVNKLTTISNTGSGDSTTTLVSKWNSETGGFSVEYINKESSDAVTYSGTLRFTPDSFVFALDTSPQLSLQINGKAGCDLTQPEYINLDKWDRDTYELLLRTYEELYGSIYSFTPDTLPHNDTDVLLIPEKQKD